MSSAEARVARLEAATAAAAAEVETLAAAAEEEQKAAAEKSGTLAKEAAQLNVLKQRVERDQAEAERETSRRSLELDEDAGRLVEDRDRLGGAMAAKEEALRERELRLVKEQGASLYYSV